MATKNHKLDGPILAAAMEEFLANGYDGASLRKIAAGAGVTVGAIYTRWPTKDMLFCTLTQPLVQRIGETFRRLREEYYGVTDPAGMADTVRREQEAVLHLLFDDRDRAVLLLCRSTGSSLEHFFEQVVEEKIRETETFFAAARGETPDLRVLRLLIGAQFHMYRQIVSQGWAPEEARSVMDSVMTYQSGGWKALLGLNEEKGSVPDEV